MSLTVKITSPIFQTLSELREEYGLVSFYFEHGYPAMQAIIEKGVIGDFRSPNIMRFGITPLYISKEDIDLAIEVISNVIQNSLWDRPKYKKRKFVT